MYKTHSHDLVSPFSPLIPNSAILGSDFVKFHHKIFVKVIFCDFAIKVQVVDFVPCIIVYIIYISLC